MVLGWCAVTEAGLVALPVVEHLDELEQVSVCFGTRAESDAAADPGDLDFQARPERLDSGVIERSPTLPNDSRTLAFPAVTAKSNDVY